jgi:hypothetical protein
MKYKGTKNSVCNDCFDDGFKGAPCPHIELDTQEIQEWEYIVFNLKQSLKHEIEGTNIGAYKDDVKKYTQEAKSFISQKLKEQREEIIEYIKSMAFKDVNGKEKVYLEDILSKYE